MRNLLNFYGMSDCKPTPTPITSEEFGRDCGTDESPELGPGDARRYRAAAATINYLSQDRPDLAVASCALARSMSQPREADVIRVKRAIRYLRGVDRGEIVFRWQDASTDLTVWTDSDWASCRASRRSCSGGALFRGSHLLHHWCRLQAQVALSSGEAELHAGNRGLIELAGAAIAFEERLGEGVMKQAHCLDSSAAKGFFNRRGSGAMKHLETKWMWGQNYIHRHRVCVQKVSREIN